MICLFPFVGRLFVSFVFILQNTNRRRNDLSMISTRTVEPGRRQHIISLCLFPSTQTWASKSNCRKTAQWHSAFTVFVSFFQQLPAVGKNNENQQRNKQALGIITLLCDHLNCRRTVVGACDDIFSPKKKKEKKKNRNQTNEMQADYRICFIFAISRNEFNSFWLFIRQLFACAMCARMFFSSRFLACVVRLLLFRRSERRNNKQWHCWEWPMNRADSV